jgi:hypothetical protein
MGGKVLLDDRNLIGNADFLMGGTPKLLENSTQLWHSSYFSHSGIQILGGFGTFLPKT